MSEIDTFSAVAERLSYVPLSRALGYVGLSAASFVVPPEERLYRIVRAEQSSEVSISMNPSVDDTVQEITTILKSYQPQRLTKPLDTRQLTGFVGTMFQFSDRNGLSDIMSTPHECLKNIYGEILEMGAESSVTLSGQFEIALKNSANVPSAVWNLFLASRQLARMRDGAAVDEFPNYSSEEKVELMKRWERSVAAVKPPDERGYQDAAGDTYYVWTHALARIIYSALPEERNALIAGYEKAFWYGSHVMSASCLLGKVSGFGTNSNHIPASRYGNAIGDTIVDAIKRT